MTVVIPVLRVCLLCGHSLSLTNKSPLIIQVCWLSFKSLYKRIALSSSV